MLIPREITSSDMDDGYHLWAHTLDLALYQAPLCTLHLFSSYYWHHFIGEEAEAQ